MLARRAVALLVLLAAALADLAPAEWQRVRRELGELTATAGEAPRKFELIDAATREDSARVATLLVDLAAASATRRDKLPPRIEKADAELKKITRRLRRTHGKRTPRSVLEKDRAWRSKRDQLLELRTQFEAETAVLGSLRNAFAGMRAAESVAVLVDLSNTAVKRARAAVEVRRGILQALWNQPIAQAAPHLLVFASDPAMPDARTRVLRWVGEHGVKQGYDVAVESLQAPEASVVRAAVAALRGLDDPRCVPALVEARKKATGLLAEELESTLHHFTGQSFFGPGADVMWAGWWRSSGEAWLRTARTGRFQPPEEAPGKARKGNAAFYGIETRSERIVFVLDRSGSMQAPVPQSAPVSGASRDDRVPGGTRIEVAKNQLARSIRKLTPNVKFAVVFYSHEVRAWQAPPGLMPATPDNKRKAIAWFTELRPVGSTLVFEALDTALQYAKVGGGKSATDPRGADTIFLLSDGAPSTPDGHALLTGDALDTAVERFLDANRAFGCVVHTIGVGPQHNRALMQRLAKETGGTYKAVGMG